MLKLDIKSELEALHTNNVKESLHLEYKASAAIDKRDDNKKLEMARDVSAFANADGGQVVYGITEKDNEPAGIDLGIGQSLS
jgi:predicted HTH transcriptional regulator